MADPKKNNQQPQKQAEPAHPVEQKAAEAAKKMPDVQAGPPAAPVATEPQNKYDAVAAAIAAALKKTEEEAASKKAAPTPAGGASTKVDRWPDRVKKSTVQNPVQFVWNLAEEMKRKDPQVRRTDVIKAAIAAGVAGYTARTQYQAWYQEQRESQRQAAIAAQKQAAGELKVNQAAGVKS